MQKRLEATNELTESSISEISLSESDSKPSEFQKPKDLYNDPMLVQESHESKFSNSKTIQVPSQTGITSENLESVSAWDQHMILVESQMESTKLKIEDLQQSERIQHYSVDEIRDSVEHNLFVKSIVKDREQASAIAKTDAEVFEPGGQLQISGKILRIESERQKQLAELEEKREELGQEVLREKRVQIEQNFQKRLIDLDQLEH